MQDAEIRKAEKEEEWARQDKVAKKAEEATRAVKQVAIDVASNQVELKASAAEVKKVAAETAHNADTKINELGEQVERVHKLVNSDMTAARFEQKQEAEEKLVVLKRIVEMDIAAGKNPSKKDLNEIKKTEKTIKDLGLILADRLERQRIVDEEKKKKKERE